MIPLRSRARSICSVGGIFVCFCDFCEESMLASVEARIWAMRTQMDCGILYSRMRKSEGEN